MFIHNFDIFSHIYKYQIGNKRLKDNIIYYSDYDLNSQNIYKYYICNFISFKKKLENELYIAIVNY